MKVAIASENKQRKLAQSIVGDDLVAEKGAFTVTIEKGEEIREVPFAYYPNFMAKLADVINQHERQVLKFIQRHYLISEMVTLDHPRA